MEYGSENQQTTSNNVDGYDNYNVESKKPDTRIPVYDSFYIKFKNKQKIIYC